MGVRNLWLRLLVCMWGFPHATFSHVAPGAFAAKLLIRMALKSSM